MTSTDLQQIAKERYCCAGTVWHVATSGNDTTGDGLSWGTAYATPAKVQSVAASGDLVLLGSMFNIGSGTFSPAAGVNVCGIGPSVGITGSIGGAGSLVTIAGTSQFEDFSIVGAVANGQYQFPLSVAASANAVIRNLLIMGQTDCIYFNQVTNATLRAFNCELTTNWDALFLDISTGCLVELHDCRIVSNGPTTGFSSSAPFYGTGISANFSHPSTIRVFCGSITATNNESNNTAIHTDSADVYLYGTRIITAGAGTLLDLFADEDPFDRWSGTITVADAVYNPAKTSGTITIVPGLPVQAVGNTGTGANAVTLTITNGSTPIQNATVNLSQNGSVFSGLTNASGVVSFSLNSATYTVAITATGYSFAPATLAVSGTTSHTYAMTAVNIPAATNPNQTNAYGYTYDGEGNIATGVQVNFRLFDPLQTSNVYNRSSFSATSNSSGLIQVLLIQGAKYEFQVQGDAQWTRFTAGTGTTFQLPELLSLKF